MNKNLYLFIAMGSFLLMACGPSKKEQRLEELHNQLEDFTNARNDYQDQLKGNDNDEIDEYISNFVGRPITKGHNRKACMDAQQRQIERIRNEIERVRDE